MPFEIVVGLLVVDHEKYAHYRQAIVPVLRSYGGRLRFDFEVSRTLKSETSQNANRLFVLRFPDRASKQRFFADPQYLEIRRAWFENAVSETEIIAEYVT